MPLFGAGAGGLCLNRMVEKKNKKGASLMDLRRKDTMSGLAGTEEKDEREAYETVKGPDVWAQVMVRLRKQIVREDYDRWIQPLRFLVEHDGTALIAAETRFAFSRVSADYKLKIQRVWSSLDGRKRPVRLVCWATLDPDLKALVNSPWADELAVRSKTVADTEPTADTNVMGPGVMRFDTLVVGASNEIATTLAERIAEGADLPASIVTINGPQGVGKTHLMKALETRLEAQGKRRVAYISAEEFYVAYVDGATNRDTRALKARVREADVVLFDDLQIVAGKQGTNRELAGTLRTVSERGGIVVVTADEPLVDLAGLSEQVRTVLRGAASVQVELPDQEMRYAIVRERADMLTRVSPKFVLEDTLCAELVERVEGPGRDLCGALLSLYAETKFGQVAPTLQMLEAIVSRKQGKKKPMSLDAIKRAVCKELGVTRSELEGPRRFKRLVRARNIGMYLSRTLTQKSYPQIAIAYGDRHHTTVLHAFEKVTGLVPDETDWVEDIDRVTRAAARISTGRIT